jgi:hypothetical protein
MTEQQLDELYTQTCQAMTALGAEKSELFLARLSLLLMQALDEPARIRELIAAAAQLQ